MENIANILINIFNYLFIKLESLLTQSIIK